MKPCTLLALVCCSLLAPSLPGQASAPAAADKDGVLVRYTANDGQFSVVFRVPNEQDGIREASNTAHSSMIFVLQDGTRVRSNREETSDTAQSYIHIDTDTEYTETATWTDCPSPVTVRQLNDSLRDAISGFRHTSPAQTINGQYFPASTEEVRIVSRRDIAVAGQAGLEITANDNDSLNGFFRVFPAGHRLYLLSVLTNATEEPDVPTNNHKIEVERFFNSFNQTTPAQSGQAGPPGANEIKSLHFDYSYHSDPFVRIMRGTVDNPQGLRDALSHLQAPRGARGDYGLLGDDSLLGKEPGYGLRQLGRVARKFLKVDYLEVQQPGGWWEKIGVQPGTFHRVEEMNDTTLGWVFFDLRPKFEADLKQLPKSSE